MPAGENETAYSYESVASKLLRFGPGSVSPSFSSLKKRERHRERANSSLGRGVRKKTECGQKVMDSVRTHESQYPF